MNREKLESVIARYEKLSAEIADPAVIADTALWSGLCKEHTALAPIA